MPIHNVGTHAGCIVRQLVLGRGSVVENAAGGRQRIRFWAARSVENSALDQRKNVEPPISYDVFLHGLGRRYRTIRHLIPPATNPIAKEYKDANNRSGDRNPGKSPKA